MPLVILFAYSAKSLAPLITHLFLFYLSKKYIFDGLLYSVYSALPKVMLVIVPLNSVIWIKVGHQCKNKLWCATTNHSIHRIIVELWRKLLLQWIYDQINTWGCCNSRVVGSFWCDSESFKSVPLILRV